MKNFLFVDVVTTSQTTHLALIQQSRLHFANRPYQIQVTNLALAIKALRPWWGNPDVNLLNSCVDTVARRRWLRVKLNDDPRISFNPEPAATGYGANAPNSSNDFPRCGEIKVP